MIFRCTTCQTSVAVQTDGNERQIEVSCARCGQRYDLDAAQLRGAALRRLGNRARRLTGDEGIDLPAAYSVALELITIDRVRDTVATADPNLARAGVESNASIEYDTAFAPAVEAGRLTSAQAMERGQRSIYCQQLRRRHKLSIRLAEAVADNRMSLLRALRMNDASDAAPVRVSASGRSTSIAVVAGVAALVGLAIVGTIFGPAPVDALEASARLTLGQAEYVTDRRGRLLRIEGPDPRTVLRTFCAVGAEPGRYEPASLVPIETANGMGRLGLLRVPDAPGALLAITIREDREAGLWVAGAEGSLLVAKPAPNGAARDTARR